MSNKQDFNWNTEGPIVLQQQRKTAIYTNLSDDVVIRQEADWNEEDDPYVVIGSQNLRRIIERLTELADELEGGAHPQARPPVDPTAAERQRRRRERNKGAGNVVTLPQAAE